MSQHQQEDDDPILQEEWGLTDDSVGASTNLDKFVVEHPEWGPESGAFIVFRSC